MSRETIRQYNLHLIDRSDCLGSTYPPIPPVNIDPVDLIGFNEVLTARDTNCGVHFFIDDYQFQRCWQSPEVYIDRLAQFDCVFTPDFSLYADMPIPMQQWNIYRSRALGHYWNQHGINVVPTLQWSTPDTFDDAFYGFPHRSTVAVSTIGVRNNPRATYLWVQGMDEAIRRVDPTRILHYGTQIAGYDFGTIPVHYYRNHVIDRMVASNGRARR